MQLLAHARDALVRNWRIVLLYLAGSIVVLTGYGLAFEAMIEAVPTETTPKPLWYVATSLSMDLIFVVIIAALQAVAFALVGEEMDRPLWKCAGWQDGLKRFFTLWFIVNLLFVTSARIPMSMPESIQLEVYVLMALFRFGLTVLSVPLGACIVFGGGLRWEDVPGMLAPFFRLFPMAFVAVSMGFLQWLIIDISSAMFQGDERSVWLWSVVNVPLIMLECLAFAVMWLVCMHHRDISDEFEDNDNDFDF